MSQNWDPTTHNPTVPMWDQFILIRSSRKKSKEGVGIFMCAYLFFTYGHMYPILSISYVSNDFWLFQVLRGGPLSRAMFAKDCHAQRKQDEFPSTEGLTIVWFLSRMLWAFPNFESVTSFHDIYIYFMIYIYIIYRHSFLNDDLITYLICFVEIRWDSSRGPSHFCSPIIRRPSDDWDAMPAMSDSDCEVTGTRGWRGRSGTGWSKMFSTPQ